MRDRRKSTRKASKTIDFKQNKIAKIIFVKTIALPLLTLVLSILFLGFSSLFDYFEVKKISDKNIEVLQKIKKIEKDTKNLLAQNQSIKQKLLSTNNNIIDQKRVKPLVQKIVDYLTLQKIIQGAYIDISSDSEYQNVLNINIQTEYDKNILNQEVLKNIFILVFRDIFYIKDISIQDQQIIMQIYKKV